MKLPELNRSGDPVVHMRRRKKDVWIETNHPESGSICLSIEVAKSTPEHRELVRKVNELLVEFLNAPPITAPVTG